MDENTVNFLLSSSALILCVCIIRGLAGNRICMRLRYGLWLVVAIRLMLPESMLTPSPISVPSGILALGSLAETQSSPEAETMAVQSGQEALQQHSDSFSQGAKPLPQGMIRGVRLLGTACTAAWLLQGEIRFARRLKRNRRLVEKGVLPVYVAPQLDSPCLYGLLRPCIYLTPAAVQEEPLHRSSIRHELCHYRQGDHIWAAVRMALLMAYWYHPLVWLAARLSREDAEFSCDEAATKNMSAKERMAYTACLVQTAAAAVQGRWATALAGGGGLMRRRVMAAVRPARQKPAVVALALLCAALAVGCTFTTGQSGTRQDESQYPAYQRKLIHSGMTMQERMQGCLAWKTGERVTEPWTAGEERIPCGPFTLAGSGTAPDGMAEQGQAAYRMPGAQTPVLTVERMEISKPAYLVIPDFLAKLMTQGVSLPAGTEEMQRIQAAVLQAQQERWPDELVASAVYPLYGDAAQEFFADTPGTEPVMAIGWYEGHGEGKVYQRYYMKDPESESSVLVFTFVNARYLAGEDRWEIYLTQMECQRWMKTLQTA